MDTSEIRFEDVTVSAGLDFQYENGALRNGAGIMVYQSLGGGVASIDYDRDGAPDLFFPQASQSHPKSSGNDAFDHLYRNFGGRCVDVSIIALPIDSGYGFGAAVGDFDGDGFPDLYVANAGQNRLMRNNGDGIFQDQTQASGIDHSAWTTSCLIADINGDGLPDLFDVNYCAGDRPFEHECFHSKNNDGIPASPPNLPPLTTNCGLTSAMVDLKRSERKQEFTRRMDGDWALSLRILTISRDWTFTSRMT